MTRTLWHAHRRAALAVSTPAPAITFVHTVVSFALALMVALTLAVPASAGTWAGKEATKDGATHVMNPATPANAPTTLTLQKQWEASGESDDYLFGVLTRITTDAKGNVYVLDSQLNEVMIFDAAGQYVRSIGRQGQGPGEFNQPADLFLTPSGNIAVLQRMPGKIVCLTPDGMPADNYPLPETDGMRMLNGGRPAGADLVLNMMQMKRNDNGMEMETTIMRVDPAGKAIATYFKNRQANDFAKMEVDEKTFGRAGLVWAAGADGRVYASDDFDAYRITVWNADGTPSHVIEREYQPRARSQQEIVDNTPRIMFRGGGGRGAEMKVNMSKTSRAVEQMFPRDDGTLWVLSSRGAYEKPDGAIATFDVFDPNGHFMDQVTLNGDGSFADDGLHLVGDRVFVVKGLASAARAMRGRADDEEAEVEEEAEPMSILCYSFNAMAKGSK